MKNRSSKLNPTNWFIGLGIIGLILGWLFSIAIPIAGFVVTVIGIITGFHHSILLGLVGFIPPIGLIEGVLHLAGLF